MGLYSSAFSLVLEQTWNGGFVNFFLGKETKKKGPRHRRAIPLDPFARKNPQTVAQMHKAKPDIIQQVERIKNNPTINVPLNIKQLRDICKKYGINSVSKLEPKKLGNTGITIVWNKPTNSFILKK